MRLRPGEAEAGGWRVENISDVVDHLLEASSNVAGRPRVIGIDGRGGAGKTLIAERLRTMVPSSAIVHTDHVAWGYSIFGWGSRIIDNVLRPLHRGEAVDVDLRPPDNTDPQLPGVIRVPAGLDVVWVEGVGIIRDELADWIDASIWIQGDLDEQERRMDVRDGVSPEHQRFYAEWVEEELPLLLREVPWDKATLVITNTVDLDYDAETQIVVSRRSRGPGSTESHPR